jgi:AcrR family transcriptional regulator
MSDIAAAAREVFCERGFEAASTAEIAARAGVAEGTLYTHFQNKRALLIKVLELWYHALISDFTSQLASIHGARNKIYFMVSRHLRALQESADLARLSYNEVRHSDDYYQSKLYELNREYTQVFIDICREGIQNGELRPGLPIGLLRDLIFGGVDHLISGVLFNNKELHIESSADQLVALIFDGIASPPARQASPAPPLEDVAKRFERLAERMEAALPK